MLSHYSPREHAEEDNGQMEVSFGAAYGIASALSGEYMSSGSGIHRERSVFDVAPSVDDNNSNSRSHLHLRSQFAEEQLQYQQPLQNHNETLQLNLDMNIDFDREAAIAAAAAAASDEEDDDNGRSCNYTAKQRYYVLHCTFNSTNVSTGTGSAVRLVYGSSTYALWCTDLSRVQ